MAVNPIKNNTANAYNAAKTTTGQNKTINAKSGQTQTAKNNAAKNNPAMVYKKSAHNAVSKQHIQKLLGGGQDSLDSFKQFITDLLNKQYGTGNMALGKALEGIQVDDATRAKAQEEISEDGYYGVKKTSERILDFAKALSGGDPANIATLRKAVEDGFKAAEKMWGGELPQISKDTYDAVMKGFDEWEQSFVNKE